MAGERRAPVETTGPREVLWFVLLWAGGVAAVALVAGVVRLAMPG